MVDSVVACVEKELAAQLPREQLILSVCAKGDTSEYVAEGLLRLGYRCANLAGGMRAWGEFYSARTVTESPELAIYQISRAARGCLSYVIAGEGRAIVVDPSRHLGIYRDLLREKKLALEAVIDTHGHADHISGGAALAAEAGCKYWLHPYDAIHPMDMLPARISYEALRDGQIFRVGKPADRSAACSGAYARVGGAADWRSVLIYRRQHFYSLDCAAGSGRKGGCLGGIARGFVAAAGWFAGCNQSSARALQQFG